MGGGAPEHSKPLYQSARLGNDEEMLGGRGIWGAMATYEDAQAGRFLYVPMWGPPSMNAPQFPHRYGDTPNGSVMAFLVSAEAQQLTLIPVWISRDMHVPDPPVVANGVVYAIQTGENTVQNPGRPGGDVTGGGGGQGSRGGGPQVPSGVEQASATAAALKAAKFRATRSNQARGLRMVSPSSHCFHNRRNASWVISIAVSAFIQRA